jgi:tyrosyl-tRNA synthetase
MLLQAYDFLQLYKRYSVNVQMGGSDQWGNITAGIELIRRTEGGEAYGLTAPLVTTSAGTKFGKTEAGAVWLDPAKTSPYQFYQFWINVEDRDVGRYLRSFTFLPREEIEALDAQVMTAPEQRAAQRQLALDVTSRVHNHEVALTAQEISALLFGRADPYNLSLTGAKALEHEIPFMVAGSEQTLLDMMVQLQLSGSKGDARRLVQQGGVSVNGIKVTPDALLANLPKLLDQYYLIRRGSRDYGLVRTAAS